MISFTKDKDFSGFFKDLPKRALPSIGDVLKVRFTQKDNSGYCKAGQVTVANDEVDKCSSVRLLNGAVSIRNEASFGFVDDVFVPGELIKKHNISNGDVLNVKAILAFNKKKNEWSWKAVAVA